MVNFPIFARRDLISEDGYIIGFTALLSNTPCEIFI